MLFATLAFSAWVITKRDRAGAAAGRDRYPQQRNRAHVAPIRARREDGRRDEPHKHPLALLCRQVRRRRGRGVHGRVRARRARRLHRNDAKDLGHQRVLMADRANLVVPRAAVAGAADAVLRAGRGDVLLPQPVAAAGAGRGALCRRLRVAIPVSGNRELARDRCAGDHNLQSGFGKSAGAGAAERSAAVRRPHADDAGRAGLLVQSGHQRGANDHQRRQQSAPWRTAVGTDRFPLRSVGPV